MFLHTGTPLHQFRISTYGKKITYIVEQKNFDCHLNFWIMKANNQGLQDNGTKLNI